MLNKNFIDELFRLCLLSERVLFVCNKHLEYHYLPNDVYKTVWKEIKTHFSLYNKPPTIGILSQKNQDNQGYLNLLELIKQTDVRDQKESILDELENFLKNSKLKAATLQVAELYTDGKKEEAHELFLKESEELTSFTIKDEVYDRVFKEFKVRQENRQNKERNPRIVIPTGIPQLDYDIRGGIEKGTALLALGRSGAGKSTLLKWVAISAARVGFKVLHFQAEGARQNTMDSYDSAFSGISLDDIKLGNNIPEETLKKINAALDAQVASRGEIVVKSFEQFTKPSILQCRDILKETIKAEGHIDLVVFDYLELFNPDEGKYANNKDGEKRRKTDTARKVINIATEFHVAVATATQANDIPRDLWNDPDKVIERNHISNDKETVQPFRYFITLNQTEDESANQIMRIFEDKLTDFPTKGTFKVYQNLERHRFVDVKRTVERFWDHETKTRRS